MQLVAFQREREQLVALCVTLCDTGFPDFRRRLSDSSPAECPRAANSMTFTTHDMVGFHPVSGSRNIGKIVASPSKTEFVPTTPPEP